MTLRHVAEGMHFFYLGTLFFPLFFILFVLFIGDLLASFVHNSTEVQLTTFFFQILSFFLILSQNVEHNAPFSHKLAPWMG